MSSVAKYALGPLGVVASITLVFRAFDQKLHLAKYMHDIDPSAEQMVMPTPPFCTAVKPEMQEHFFYFDLGGTYCACEKQWNVAEYWRKTFSGRAFNLPHFIDALVACLVFGDLKAVCFAVGINEFIEEFIVATSPH